MFRTSRVVIATSILTWVVVVGLGMLWLLKFERVPGAAGSPGPDWPGGSLIERKTDRPTLLMFVHPRCPCTRASLGELEQILALCPDSVATQIVIFKPHDGGQDWLGGDVPTMARKIP